MLLGKGNEEPGGREAVVIYLFYYPFSLEIIAIGNNSK